MELDDQRADGGTFDVQCGETIALRLDENPTTGYRWHITAEPSLDIESDDFVPAATAAVGGGGRRLVVFRVSTPGQFRVRAKLWREWLGESSAIKRCEFLVRCAN